MSIFKKYTTQYSMSLDIEEHLISTGHYEDILSKEMSHNLASHIEKDFRELVKTTYPENPYISSVKKLEIVVMDMETWDRINSFLHRNNFHY